ncbi:MULTISPECIES: hypothetical protein [Streptococcus]|uniref:Uncharacterized protein n=1 Tax=Streptococcus mitis TaxID=28037 RepID=A0A139PPP7_STRMT|nr:MULTISPECIES: hypothetical protein [Streptococcus]KXT92275.1 hypothetical protein SMIDD26_01304 [Streptococcus mitis]
MFFGTNFLFKICYFWTAMLPAYIIILLKKHDELKCLSLNFFNISISIEAILLPVFIIFTLFSLFYLLCKIKRTEEKKTGQLEITINFNVEKDKNDTVDNYGFYTVNPNLMEYLLSIVVTSGITSLDLSQSLYIQLFIFVVVQILLLLYVLNSSDPIPNLLLVICRKDIVSVEDKLFIICDRSILKQRLYGFKKIIPFSSRDARNRLFVFKKEG